jgi:two-component system, cell cycle response regulator
MDEPAVVLLVDDDAEVRSFLRAILEAEGHRVDEAASGQEALMTLAQQHPQLVLLDVRMPAMDGFAVAQAIRTKPGPYVPIILLTADDDLESRARGIAAGADEVLGKPAHPFELKLRVRAMLRIQHLTAELHAANRRLRLLARTDELTQVRNRRGLRAALEREFARAARYGGRLALIAVDLDRFKRVNDEHGHQAGDQLLRAVAEAMGAALRKTDILGRTGGEEFVVVAPETGAEEARVVAERLRRATSELEVLAPDGAALRATVSCGVAALGDLGARTPDELLAHADRALYRAKALGRDRCEVARAGEGTLLTDRRDLDG